MDDAVDGASYVCPYTMRCKLLPAPLTEKGSSVVDKRLEQDAQALELYTRPLSSVCLCRTQPYSTEKVSCVSITEINEGKHVQVRMSMT